MASAPRDERPLRAYKKSSRFVIGTRLLGERVRELRLSKGWTLEHAAERMHVDFAHLQKIESGRVNVTIGTFLRIADGLGHPPGALFDSGTSDRRAYPRSRARSGNTSATPVPTTLDSAAEYRRATSSKEREAAIREDGASLLLDAGRRVSELRATLGMTQQVLAQAVGVSVAYLQRVEAGRQNLTLRSLARFAWGLGVHAAALLEPPGARRYARRRAK